MRIAFRRSGTAWRRGVGAAALTVALVGAGSLARTEPVSAKERIPVDVRRTTLIVRDIERALAFYRDALGLKPIYDERLPASAASDRPTPLRLVLLRANDDFIGALGLLQYLDDKPPKPVTYERPGVGGVIFVVNVKDLEQRFEGVRRVPGVKIGTEPKLIEYPAPDGGKIPVLVSTVWDPDGYFVELNKLLGRPAGSER
jgi:catechol 2,3-dioxygenase-like lactoylglutathione lyase family enzyme